jgi:metal-sulfur cluster biosynthetic enzyme
MSDPNEKTPKTSQPAANEPGASTPTEGAAAAFEADAASLSSNPTSSSDAAPSSSTPTSAPSQQELAIRSALETVMDPEIGLSVIDLGLIREIKIEPGKTLVRMMLTTPFCPYAPQMMADVKQATESVLPQACEVELMPDAWSPDLMPDPGLLGYSF